MIASVKPLQNAPMYHRIDVTDNGIGFDEQYLDRIFPVFQRLHGKGKFAGTGIDLAICEKVVTNHRGESVSMHQLSGLLSGGKMRIRDRLITSSHTV